MSQNKEKFSGSTALFCLALTLAVFVAWANALNAPFVLDDSINITNNLTIRGLGADFAPWYPPDYTSVSGRPLANLSFAFDYALWELNPAGFRAVNMALHLFCAFLLMGIARRTFALEDFPPFLRQRAVPLAFGAALLWAVHPFATGAVTYISQRCEVLMALFFLGALYCAIRGWQGKKAFWWHLAAGLCLVAGAGAKEVIAAAPFAIYAYDRVFFKRGVCQALAASPVLYAGSFVGLFILLALVATGRQAATAFTEVSPLSYALTQTQVLFYYLKKAFWPLGLNFDLWWNPAKFAYAWPYAIMAALLVCSAFFLFLKKRPLGFAGAFFFLAIAPSSSFYPLPDMAVEYRVYLPLAAIAAIVAGGGAWLLERVAKERWFVVWMALTATMAFGLTAATIARNYVFADALNLWTDTVQKAPHNPRARVNLADALQSLGRHDLALGHLEKAREISPATATIYGGLGWAYLELGDIDKAFDNLEKAISLEPKRAVLHMLMALTLVRMGEKDAAIKSYETALQLDPHIFRARYNLANLLLEKGQSQQALNLLEQVVANNPNHAGAWVNMGVILFDMGNIGQAIACFEKALAINPQMEAALINLQKAKNALTPP
ncbi:MAG: tetratricopeptide repeat protein [Desulfatibacillaceae bacterium]|nr:tetratricopeptide repeat protein [Desulfatibacillaceae bacterium]